MRLIVLTLACAVFGPGCGTSKTSKDDEKTAGEPAQAPKSASDAAARATKPDTPKRMGRFFEGEPAPELPLPSIADGKPMSLAAMRGKKTLLLVFASW